MTDKNRIDKNMTEKKTITVLVPCYQSETYLEKTVLNICDCINNNGEYDYHIILVDDRSPDQTWSVIHSLCQLDSKIVGVHLSENQGQSKAKLLGLRFVKGDYLIFMDDDGQHPAQEMFRMIDCLNQGYDVVYAQFPVLKEVLYRRIASGITNIILTLIAKKPGKLRVTSYIALNKDSIRQLQNMTRQYPLVFQTLAPYTTKIGMVQMAHQPRTEGTSRYTIKKLVRMWMKLIFSQPIEIPADDSCIEETLNQLSNTEKVAGIHL